MKKLRRMDGGEASIIIYLKMQLIAMKKGGILEYTGLEPSFAEELALELDEEEEDIQRTLDYLLSCGLMEQRPGGREYDLPEVVENTGSESPSTERMRRLRERQASLARHIGVTEASPCDGGVTFCDTEKEIEIESESESESDPDLYPDLYADAELPSEKEEDLQVQKEREQEQTTEGRASALSLPAGASMGTMENLRAYGPYGWVKLTDAQYNNLIGTLGFEEAKRCIDYVDEMAQGNGNKNKWQDWYVVVRKCHREGWGLRGHRRDTGFKTNNPFLEILEEMRNEA